MRHPLSVALAVSILAAHGGSASPARACSRAVSPLESLPVGVAVADAIVVAEALTIAGGRAEVRVLETLAGPLAPGARVVVSGPETLAESPRRGLCDLPVTAVGGRYVLLLWAPIREGADWTLVDEAGGQLADGPATRARLVAALAAPAPASPWRAEGALRARLVRTPAGGGEPAGSLDLLVVVQNLGDQALTWRYESWPEAEQSRCLLDVVHAASGARVEARPVPIAPADIAAYFSRHGTRYRLEVAPARAALIRLPRVTTAPPGWGYKEELGFRYYPTTPAQAGPLRISARCEGWLGEGARLVTDFLAVSP